MSAASFAFAMNRTASARIDRFRTESLATATPAQLLVRLYERLLLDLDRAHEAQLAGQHRDASEQLLHAQAIVSELASSLDVDAWEGGSRLMSVYTFLLAELVRANVDRAPERTRGCRDVVAPLVEAWREAAAQAGPAPGAAPAADSATVPGPRVSAVG